MSLQQEDVVNCLALMIIHRHRIAKITYDIYFSEGIQIHIRGSTSVHIPLSGKSNQLIHHQNSHNALLSHLIMPLDPII